MTRAQRRAGLLLRPGRIGSGRHVSRPTGGSRAGYRPVGGALIYGALLLFLFFISNQADGVFSRRCVSGGARGMGGRGFRGAHHLSVHRLSRRAAGARCRGRQIANPASRRFGMNLGMLIFGWILVGSALRARQSGAGRSSMNVICAFGMRRAASRNGLMSMMMIGLIVLLCSLPEQSRSWMRPLMVGNSLVGLLIARTLAENIYSGGALPTRTRDERHRGSQPDPRTFASSAAN